jgi:predicted branched-subunit amino acid permease
MTTLNRTLLAHPEFKRGCKDMMALAPGIGAWGLMTGVAMVNSGMGIVTAALMTLTIYAGSAQLAVTPLMMAGAPIWVILATAACVNLRFVVFSIHLRPYLMHMSLRERLFSGYFTGDLSYVLFVNAYPLPGKSTSEKKAQVAYLMGTCAVNYLAWMGGSLVGIALAAYIPLSWGLAFAGTLALVGLVCALITSRLRLLGVVIASGAAVLAYSMPLRLNILVAIGAAVAICLLTEHFIKRYTPARAATAKGKA